MLILGLCLMLVFKHNCSLVPFYRLLANFIISHLLISSTTSYSLPLFRSPITLFVFYYLFALHYLYPHLYFLLHFVLGYFVLPRFLHHVLTHYVHYALVHHHYDLQVHLINHLPFQFQCYCLILILLNLVERWSGFVGLLHASMFLYYVDHFNCPFAHLFVQQTHAKKVAHGQLDCTFRLHVFSILIGQSTHFIGLDWDWDYFLSTTYLWYHEFDDPILIWYINCFFEKGSFLDSFPIIR